MNNASPLPARARSFLFLPADRLERLPKALASGAHAVVLDLEDAVAAEAKPNARESLLHAWREVPADGRARMLVRVNARDTPWHQDDLALARNLAGLGAVMLPKSESATAIEHAAHTACAPVLPLIESAQGFQALGIVARARGVLRLAFGHLDFQADIGMQCGDDERELDSVRLAVVLASRRADLPSPVDGVTVSLDDEARLLADAGRSRRFGFGAKLCIHPKQVAPVNEALGPTPAQREWARRVLDASAAHGTGAFRLEGEMVDAPVLQRARSILET